MVYIYQEYEDGVHNFNNHFLMSLHLCLTIRARLQTHIAVSRLVESIEATHKVSFPNRENVLHAYLHFEALTEHDYTFACLTCGYNPAVVVMDLHNKGVFSLPHSAVQ